ncbi:MAG: hypothetical protein Q8R15_05260 [Candidatus Micrarchaeota archaeon]|nr:hypothetical protein [Candidatus Micrarchaeota archaeon]
MMKLKKQNESCRGFIGPLGDDIPSIFPIVAGMLLFISTILYANAQVDSRNVDLKEREATQKLGYLATQKGSFQPGEFQRICETSLKPFAENIGLKFAVVAKRFCDYNCPGPSCQHGINLETSNIYNEDDAASSLEPNPNNICTNDKEDIKLEYLAARLDKTKAPKNAVVLIYPLAVPCPEQTSPVNGLGTLNVIVWR